MICTPSDEDETRHLLTTAYLHKGPASVRYPRGVGSNAKVNKDLDKFLDNLTIIEKDLVSIFEKNNIKKIETNKKKFDPNFHQAMSEVEDNDVDPGTILHEIQAGYMLGERLLRPALVAVAKKKSSKKQA